MQKAYELCFFRTQYLQGYLKILEFPKQIFGQGHHHFCPDVDHDFMMGCPKDCLQIYSFFAYY